MSRKAKVKATRYLPTYTRLRGVSWYAMKVAKATEKGRLDNLMSAMLYSAFCLEAYLNHLGEAQIPYWEVLKRRLGPAQKLDVLSQAIDYELDRGKRPFQSFDTIFRFRNRLAHAETEQIDVEQEMVLAEGESPPKPLSDWEQLVTLENAQRFLDDTEEMIDKFSKHLDPESESPFAPETWQTTTEYFSDSDAGGY